MVSVVAFVLFTFTRLPSCAGVVPWWALGGIFWIESSAANFTSGVRGGGVNLSVGIARLREALCVAARVAFVVLAPPPCVCVFVVVRAAHAIVVEGFVALVLLRPLLRGVLEQVALILFTGRCADVQCNGQSSELIMYTVVK